MIICQPRTWTLKSTNVPENDHPEWAAGTTYAKGAKVIVASLHKRYESLEAENTGNSPATSPEWWLDLGATNAYLMFDPYINTRTEYDHIHVKLNVSRSDFVGFYNTFGGDVLMKLWNPDETTLYWEKTFSLVYGSQLILTGSWSDYYFGEYNYTEDFFQIIGVNSFDAVLEIKITAPTGIDATCGHIDIGRMHRIGATRYGASIGLLDFSKKLTDDFGRTYLAQGSFAKVNSYEVVVENSKLDSVFKLLTSVRGIATSFVGDSREEDVGRIEATVNHGFVRDFGLVVEGPSHSILRIEITGLI